MKTIADIPTAEWIHHEPKESTKDIAGAVKYDGGKSPIFRGALSYFPKAIDGVASVSAFGATKYAWKGWRYVPDGFNRYSDAMVRHLLAEGEDQAVDNDSGLPHHLHTLWNCLARSELILIAEAVQKSSRSVFSL